MSSTLTFNRDLAETDADKKAIKAAHLSTETLRDGDDVTVYREKRPDDKLQWFGHGGKDKRSGNVAHKYAELVASGGGTGTAGDAIEGELIAAVTDSDGRVLAERTVGDLDTLAAAASDARTERPTMAALAPYLTQGRYMELRINADAASDGVELDTANSSQRVWYSQV